MDLTHYYLERIDTALHALLPSIETSPTQLHQAMRYAVLNGGKRVRALLCYFTGKIFSIPENQLDVIAAALECIHAYSLIHDDLPAMDDASLRRGQPSCHIAFDEATAILAGDALQTEAFTILSEAGITQNIASVHIAHLVKTLAQASGSQGMAGGQMLDLALTHFSDIDKDVSLIAIEKILNVSRLKTAALIKASIIMPLILANLDSSTLKNFAHLAEQLGIAFQIQDDILDITQSSALLGKNAGIDEKNNKMTYAHLAGIENAQEKVSIIFEENINLLKTHGSNASFLIQYLEWLYQRQN